MSSTLVVPQFPFTLEEVVAGAEARELFLGLAAEYGDDLNAWGDELSDADFRAALASHWVFLFGRTPDREDKKMLEAVLQVTDDQFTARTLTGAVPFET